MPAHAEHSANTEMSFFSLVTAGLLLAEVLLDIPCKWAERQTFHSGRKLTAIIMKSMHKLLYSKKSQVIEDKINCT